MLPNQFGASFLVAANNFLGKQYNQLTRLVAFFIDLHVCLLRGLAAGLAVSRTRASRTCGRRRTCLHSWGRAASRFGEVGSPNFGRSGLGGVEADFLKKPIILVPAFFEIYKICTLLFLFASSFARTVGDRRGQSDRKLRFKKTRSHGSKKFIYMFGASKRYLFELENASNFLI